MLMSSLRFGIASDARRRKWSDHHGEYVSEFGKEVCNRPMLTEEAQHVRSQNDPEKQQANRRRQSRAGRQPRNADAGRDNDRELCQIGQRQDV